MKLLFLDTMFHEVPGYPGYFVSRDGRVVSTKNKQPRELSRYINSTGYLQVKASIKHLMIHRALALTFLPSVEGKPDVNHKDGNKLNNELSNLEWITRGENVLHAMRNGMHNNKETPIIGVNRATGEGLLLGSQAAARRFGFSQPNINKCLARLRPHHKGWEWHYA